MLEQMLASLIGGGLMGAIFSALYNLYTTQKNKAIKERGSTEALAGEVRHSQVVADFNARSDKGGNATFIMFPTIAAINVTFQERHSYPHLAALQSDLEAYTLSLLYLNQLTEIHNSLSLDLNFESSYRNILRDQVIDICSGKKVIEALSNPIILPTFLKQLSDGIQKVVQQ